MIIQGSIRFELIPLKAAIADGAKRGWSGPYFFPENKWPLQKLLYI